MVRYPGRDFTDNDIKLLETGNFADGTVSCKGRTWKVHRSLLASRLNFFKAAFYGSFAEAKSGVVEFPEADPDSVNIMLRHLYGETLNVKELSTPVLCVRCWELADYVQLESLKDVSILSLEDHLNAMALLASSDSNLEEMKPKWLEHFFDAFKEVFAHTATEPLQTTFITFLWVTRFEILELSQTLDVLRQYPVAHKDLLHLLIGHEVGNKAEWLPSINQLQQEIRNKKKVFLQIEFKCSNCQRKIKLGPRFYNPFPTQRAGIGQLMWCKGCVSSFNEHRNWPWRFNMMAKKENIQVKAWSCEDEK